MNEQKMYVYSDGIANKSVIIIIKWNQIILATKEYEQHRIRNSNINKSTNKQQILRSIGIL